MPLYWAPIVGIASAIALLFLLWLVTGKLPFQKADPQRTQVTPP